MLHCISLLPRGRLFVIQIGTTILRPIVAVIEINLYRANVRLRLPILIRVGIHMRSSMAFHYRDRPRLSLDQISLFRKLLCCGKALPILNRLFSFQSDTNWEG